MSMTKYKIYRESGITTYATVVEKSKEEAPDGSDKYPYNYYIHVAFKLENNTDTDIQARIKLPGDTWRNISIGSKKKIIYLPEMPMTAELEQSVYGDMILLALFGFVMSAVAYAGIYIQSKPGRLQYQPGIAPYEQTSIANGTEPFKDLGKSKMKLLRPMSDISTSALLNTVKASATISLLFGFLLTAVLFMFAEAMKADSTQYELLLMMVSPLLFVFFVLLIELNLRKRIVPELMKRLKESGSAN